MTPTKMLRKIQREFEEIKEMSNTEEFPIGIEQVDENRWTEFLGQIAGPPGTPYEGGKFKLEISLSNHHPFRPPKVRFVTEIWHPNVSSQTGAIGVDILRDQWTAALTLRGLLISIQSLLADTEAEVPQPQDAIVARQSNDKPAIFRKTAEHWTAVYAEGSKRSLEYYESTQKIVEMGVDENKAMSALSRYDWNLELAADSIFH